MKKTVVFSFVACLAAGLLLNFSSFANDENPETDLVMLSLEVYARGEGANNTGPRGKEDCEGGGHRMVCRCINSQPCTDSDCF